jgi:hypothetical protein
MFNQSNKLFILFIFLLQNENIFILFSDLTINQTMTSSKKVEKPEGAYIKKGRYVLNLRFPCTHFLIIVFFY